VEPDTPRAIVTGAAGQLGQALLQTAPATFTCHGLDRAACDICDAAALGALLDEQRPALLINAAAYTAVDRAESEPEAALAANATAPGLLAAACTERGIRLLHVSTDFVFDGSRSSPYTEDAPTAPLGVYGRSKLAGERAVRQAAPDALILRTGWVYSQRGHNFLCTMLRLHGEREALSVVADQVGTPTAAHSLAEALWAAASRPAAARHLSLERRGGVQLVRLCGRHRRGGRGPGPARAQRRVQPIPRRDYPTPARRPPTACSTRRAAGATWPYGPGTGARSCARDDDHGRGQRWLKHCSLPVPPDLSAPTSRTTGARAPGGPGDRPTMRSPTPATAPASPPWR
jgi:dTDP-4-dehydrorhamnose reductase